jgi:hypothetical protein
MPSVEGPGVHGSGIRTCREVGINRAEWRITAGLETSGHEDYFSWPRISPVGLFAVCTLT